MSDSDSNSVPILIPDGTMPFYDGNMATLSIPDPIMMYLNHPVEVGIHLVDDSLPMPTYADSGSVGLDLYAREARSIEPGKLGYIPTNVIMRLPDGYMLLVALRSSAPRRYSLLMPHGMGVIDRSFCGESDEILLQVYNFGKEEVLIRRKERIGQALLLPAPRINLLPLSKEEIASHPSRGGFGSTGTGIGLIAEHEFDDIQHDEIR